MAYVLHHTHLHPSGNYVDALTLRDFESRARHDFAGPESPTPLLCCHKPRLLHSHITFLLSRLTSLFLREGCSHHSQPSDHIPLLPGPLAPPSPSGPLAPPSLVLLPWLSSPPLWTRPHCVVFSFSIFSLAPMSPPLARAAFYHSSNPWLLDHSMAYAVHRSHLHPSVTFAAPLPRPPSSSRPALPTSTKPRTPHQRSLPNNSQLINPPGPVHPTREPLSGAESNSVDDKTSSLDARCSYALPSPP
jgi:hypothetical protein